MGFEVRDDGSGSVAILSGWPDALAICRAFSMTVLPLFTTLTSGLYPDSPTAPGLAAASGKSFRPSVRLATGHVQATSVDYEQTHGVAAHRDGDRCGSKRIA